MVYTRRQGNTSPYKKTPLSRGFPFLHFSIFSRGYAVSLVLRSKNSIHACVSFLSDARRVISSSARRLLSLAYRSCKNCSFNSSFKRVSWAATMYSAMISFCVFIQAIVAHFMGWESRRPIQHNVLDWGLSS